MARARNIKPSFFSNEYLSELPFEDRLLFIGLWTLADRAGRLEDRPKRIKAALFAYDNVDVNAALDRLADGEDSFIIRYEADGSRYIQIRNFSKHQNPHKNETASTIPAPCNSGNTTGNCADVSVQMTDDSEANTELESNPSYINAVQAPEQHHTSTVQAPDMHASNRADSLNLIPDSYNLIPDPRKPASGASDACAYCTENLLSLSAGNYQDLRELMGAGITDELVTYAVDEALAQGKRTWAYVRSILNRWLVDGIRTPGEAKQSSERFKAGARAAPSGLSNKSIREDDDSRLPWVD